MRIQSLSIYIYVYVYALLWIHISIYIYIYVYIAYGMLRYGPPPPSGTTVAWLPRVVLLGAAAAACSELDLATAAEDVGERQVGSVRASQATDLCSLGLRQWATYIYIYMTYTYIHI